jgi:hypothetical protein
VGAMKFSIILKYVVLIIITWKICVGCDEEQMMYCSGVIKIRFEIVSLVSITKNIMTAASTNKTNDTHRKEYEVLTVKEVSRDNQSPKITYNT